MGSPAIYSLSMQSSWLSLAGHAILVVDDDGDTRELLRSILVVHGAEVTAAASVRDARIILDQSRPDVLITDLAMPGEDGFSADGALPTSRPDPELRALPIMALTAYGSQQAHIACSLQGSMRIWRSRSNRRRWPPPSGTWLSRSLLQLVEQSLEGGDVRRIGLRIDLHVIRFRHPVLAPVAVEANALAVGVVGIERLIRFAAWPEGRPRRCR